MTSGRFSKRLTTSKNKKNHFSILTWTGRVVVPAEEGHQVPPLVAARGLQEAWQRCSSAFGQEGRTSHEQDLEGVTLASWADRKSWGGGNRACPPLPPL